ncbi:MULTISPECIES: 3-deoxy-7-phosphoheptulonate synthase [Mycobacterium avium complex (MAC)]|uniref:Phospho-2-dehydro-3-deoxyheptonate aldolase n=1 Tax=Mycobacterium timonense TaxID=701043 RepID=A0ABX3TL89_9MYCO|nr:MULTISPECIES: 3-deoxy-7-phosphoheptulonate synthase [Mycobacterium avium complex (MAC)]ETZ51988.1 3-deoxy-7-phosphoheptulonate synthase [Mycobacterium sp. MAC_011194_8550]ETZ74860.1 3-deoxy-7-phosphoheptulonate synthase [Mycobacterium sp. MAC_080597_8934]MBZ4597970.1 3-deoxy-7-phosphoheptulonate synthase [Mycobacterium avium subsp. hominissuis]ORB79502.1 3-deoxy-7-phosphoheptulonate synthase [Mycobacterium timonense]QXD07735.1 3-deoxy-7-phosphoheptulonate synthase [Mycobacterium avium subsp
MSLTECATPAVDTSDHRIVSFRELSAPAAIRAELPLTPRRARAVQRDRDDIAAILAGADDRLLLVVGPCSVHDPVAALDYARRLAPIAAEFADRLKIVMRVYFEKPRTTIGWKGLINDPAMDGSFDVERGIRTARALLLDIIDVGMPVGCEFLEPTSPQYIADAVAWGAIGARTTESQVHRQLASGLSMPIGFKNGTDGNVQVAIDGVKAAAAPHHFFGTGDVGRAAVVETMGNPDCHVILRGGTAGPNYDAGSVAGAIERLSAAGLSPRVMVDCSHANSAKDHVRQAEVAAELIARIAAGERGIGGLMLESFLVAGAQPLGGELTYGQSVTDECMDFATTARLLAGLYAAMG